MFDQWIALWERITLSKLLLMVLGGFSLIFLSWLYEQRDSVFITLTGSPFALLTMAAVMLLVVAAWVAYMFVAMAEERTVRVILEMRARIAAAEKVSEGQDAEIERLHRVIEVEVGKEREACESRIRQLIDVMSQHGISERRNPSIESRTT